MDLSHIYLAALKTLSTPLDFELQHVMNFEKYRYS